MTTIRYSRQREAILNYLKTSNEHPTAESVYENVRRQIPNISLGTVYRNLALLVELNEIVRIRSENDVLRFDAIITDHYHWQCRKCGQVRDLKMKLHKSLNQEAAEELGEEIESHELCFFGICKECAENNDDIM